MRRLLATTAMAVILSLWSSVSFDGHGSTADAVYAYEDAEGHSYFYKSIDPEDFLLGLIVPVHSQPNLTEVNPLRCGDVLEQEGIQRVEMALRTVAEINKRPDLLPNTTLGIHIRDSCNYPPIALEQTINYIRASVWHDSDYQETPYPWSQSHSIETYSLKKCTVPEKRRNLVSVLGPATCTGTTQVQNLLQLFGIPQIGYSATAKIPAEYSKYFLSMIPNDDYQSQAMLDILVRFNWTYVYTIYSDDDDYGPMGIDRFKTKAYSRGICVAQKYVLSPRSRTSDYETTVRKMMNAHVRPTGARVIVAYLEKTILMRFLHTLKHLNATHKFLILASDSWGTDPEVVRSLEDVAEGCMTLSFPRPPDAAFREHFTTLKPETNSYNPWFREFWEDRFKCTLPGRQDTPKILKYHRWCTGNETLNDGSFREDPKLDYLRRSIYLVAYGLHRMIEDHCGSAQYGTAPDEITDGEQGSEHNATRAECVSKMYVNAAAFVAYLNRTSFVWPPGSSNASETIQVNPPGVYNIYNFRKVKERSYDYVQIGTWKGGLQLWEDPVFKGGSRILPESICSKPCEKGQIKSVWWPGDCCWKCLSCKQTQFIRDEFTCEECPKGFAPNANLTVKSSTRELSYIILVGMAMSHGTSLAFLFKPSDYSCFAVRVMPPFSLTMMYAPLLVKTVRIARILGNIRSLAITPPKRFLSSTSQVVITCILIFIQVVILTCTQLILPSGWEHDYPAWDRVALQCRMPHPSIMLPLAFNFLLIILCTAYAIKTRNVPENFNEAKLIGFTMYATVVIWISFLAIYFGSPYKSVAFALSLSFTAHVALSLMFFHKVYIILFHPEKNQPSVFRQLTDNMRMHIGAQDSSSFKSSIYNTTGDSPSPIGKGTFKLRPEKKRYVHSSSAKKKVSEKRAEQMRKATAMKIAQDLDRRLSRTSTSDPAFSLNRFIDDVNKAGGVHGAVMASHGVNHSNDVSSGHLAAALSPQHSHHLPPLLPLPNSLTHVVVSAQSSTEQDGLYANSMSRFNQFDSDNNSVTNSENLDTLDTHKSQNSDNTYESVVPVKRKASRGYSVLPGYLPQTPTSDRMSGRLDFNVSVASKGYRLSVDQGQPASTSRFKVLSEHENEVSEQEQTMSEGHEKKPKHKEKSIKDKESVLQPLQQQQQQARSIHDDMELRRYHEPFRCDWYYKQPYPSRVPYRPAITYPKELKDLPTAVSSTTGPGGGNGGLTKESVSLVRRSPGPKRSLDHTRDSREVDRDRSRLFTHRLSLDQGIGLRGSGDQGIRETASFLIDGRKSGNSTPKRRVSCERCTPNGSPESERMESVPKISVPGTGGVGIKAGLGLGDNMMLIDDSSVEDLTSKVD
ncbi:metabotropic glutamate receptor 5-like [Tropilaelaps mercedesae]|uniref:Metabotropic glutamate receptor 5-like n=1 Tax=Tropilaelaps mercedesae TaxID=418985 RepID=A0A1V9XEF8_9ACAR|nr:metabotropic glutamate receptor 5-like [Tropilaelaps mercedesae]